MNEMNPLETQLKCWKPRGPSPKLERNLFGRRSPQHTIAQSWGWLAPAAACLMLLVSIASERKVGVISAVTERESVVAVSLSNQSFASYLPGSFKNEQNRWDTFEWTNGGNFNSSVHPFPRVRTNGSD